MFVVTAATFTIAGCGGGGGSFAQLRWSDDDPAWAPSGREVFFDSNRAAGRDERDTDWGSSLYVMRTDGSGLRRLTQSGQCDDQYPDPSPNGEEIAFVRTCQGSDLWVVTSHGDLPEMLATGADTFAWAPDGRHIAVTLDRNSNDPTSGNDLWVVATDGSPSRLVARGRGPSQAIGDVAWSRDGRQIVFGCHGGSLCIADIRTGAIRQLHHFSEENDLSSVEWSPDDKELAVVDGSGGSLDPNYSAWVMAADGEHARKLPRFGDGNVDAVEWLPRHPRVLVINTDYAKAYLVRADGEHKRDLPFGVDDLTASPDGSKLLFVRRHFDSEGTYYHSAISVANVRTGEARQLTQDH
jgi:Tol biopolymer transport system component